MWRTGVLDALQYIWLSIPEDLYNRFVNGCTERLHMHLVCLSGLSIYFCTYIPLHEIFFFYSKGKKTKVG